MAFVFFAPGVGLPAAGPERERVPVLAHRRPAGSEDLDALFGKARIAGGLVRDGRNASVGVSNRDEDAVVGRQLGSCLVHRFGIHPSWKTARERDAGVDRVAGLTDDPAATDLLVLGPVIRRQWTGSKTVAERQRRGRCKEPP